MNRIGIALAADSAVSLGGSAENIYTTANNLFHLSATAPVRPDTSLARKTYLKYPDDGQRNLTSVRP